MKLLFDANLSPDLVELLVDFYPDSIHVVSIGIESSDSEIWDFSKVNGLTIVSKDSDFQQRAMVLGGPPKVVWIRLGNCRTNLVESLLRQRHQQLLDFEIEENASLLAIP